ncbi:hypothetical protein SPE26_23275 [Bacillus thuringiensis]|uniref:Replication protein n=1 Tax=Bacillus thuringiensis TaxID=1428 RepID=A0AAW9GJB4_BACTU|nr:hypothetical protein [Bacillus thuringiensis]MDY0854368.1 hypothetical protein [Bacillus thuringiensis]MDY4393642.1 hypothetical protein [Bacillus thuringiensis]
MSTIIKRRHTNQYAQIHNNPLQHDLKDLRAIGLLSHLMSLPIDWIIYKTQLYHKYSRKNIDAAWRELANKNYIIGFNCYLDGKKQSFYSVSDIPFTSEEFSSFIRETVEGLMDLGISVKSLSSIKDVNLTIPNGLTDVPSVHQSKIRKEVTTVPKVQYSQYSTFGTSTKRIYTNKKNTNNKDDDLTINTILNEREISSKNPISDNDILWITNKVKDIFKGKIQARSFNSVSNKCINNYKKGTVPNYENYLITSIENKIEELEIRREREKTLSKLIPSTKKNNHRKEIVPDWLHQQQESQETQKQYKSDIEEDRRRLMEVLQKYKSSKRKGNETRH